MSDSFLSHRRVTRALHRLAELAAAEQLALEIALCHGQIVTVVYTLPGAASGEGKVVLSSSRAAALARQVAGEQHLPAAWLDEDVKFFLALSAARNPSQLAEYGPALLLSVCEPAHLLAMKLQAFQGELRPAPADRRDLAFLLQKMRLGSIEGVEHAYARFFPDHPLGEETRRMLGELLPAPDVAGARR